jgi:adenosine deaminase
MRLEGGLAELHTHLGGSVASDILWSLAHEQGIALPVKDYWEFDRLVTVSDPRGVENLDALDAIYHWTELIQSSPIAVERSVHAAIGGAYRSQGITTLELRFNPMKRNRGGERDLDHIILAAIRGLDLASLEYPQVRAGLILMMDRTFGARLNEIIVEKAIRWAPRGIVGVDIAGPRPRGERYDYTQVAPMLETAREAGLGVTIHVGEEGGELGREEIAEVVEVLRPDRIGHGILAAGDEGARGRGCRARDVPVARRARSRLHGCHRRAGDDAHAPARRARHAAEDRRPRRGRAGRGEPAGARGELPARPPSRRGVAPAKYSLGSIARTGHRH